MIFQTMYNYKKCKGEKNRLPSQTIPDQTMSIKQLMERHAKGLPLEGAKVPVYNGDRYMPEINKMELTDRMQLAQDNAENIRKIQKELSERDEKEKHKSLTEKITNELKTLFNNDKQTQDTTSKDHNSNGKNSNNAKSDKTD